MYEKVSRVTTGQERDALGIFKVFYLLDKHIIMSARLLHKYSKYIKEGLDCRK